MFNFFKTSPAAQATHLLTKTSQQSWFSLTEKNKLSRAIQTLLINKIENPASPYDDPNSYTAAYPPSMTIFEYVMRLIHYLDADEKLYVVMLIYIFRYLNLSANNLTYLNVHRLIACSLLLALKFNSDIFYTNQVYAKVTGLSLTELNQLEAMLYHTGLNYKLIIAEDEFIQQSESLSAVMCNSR